MKSIADIYVNVILRAVLGPRASELKVDNPARLRQIAENLADSEIARSAMRAKGYGRSASSFVEAVREVPDNSPAMLKRMFAPRTPVCYPRPSARS